MKKLLALVAVLLVAVIMIQTTPDKAAHKEAMMKAINEYVEEEVDNSAVGDNILGTISKSVVTKTIETALNMKLKMNNYYLWNTTYVRMKGKNQLLSVGLLGHVFTFDKAMLREKLAEAMNEKEEAASEKEQAKQSAKELKRLQKEQKKREKELEKERKRQEKEARKAAKQAEKERKRLEKSKE